MRNVTAQPNMTVDTWQLVINTGTTIVTFLVVFLIQNTQNLDSLAVQLKLSELVLAMKGAKNEFAAIKDLSDEELARLHNECRARAEMYAAPPAQPPVRGGRETAQCSPAHRGRAAHVAPRCKILTIEVRHTLAFGFFKNYGREWTGGATDALAGDDGGRGCSSAGERAGAGAHGQRDFWHRRLLRQGL